MRRGGLGRGLSSLIPGASEARGLLDVPVDAITSNPRQPRRDFAEEGLEALAESIREVGVLQPVVVRARGSGYELVAGERRVRAARLAGLATVPAVVRDTDDFVHRFSDDRKRGPVASGARGRISGAPR